jgi:hypothetical protein
VLGLLQDGQFPWQLDPLRASAQQAQLQLPLMLQLEPQAELDLRLAGQCQRVLELPLASVRLLPLVDRLQLRLVLRPALVLRMVLVQP